MLRYVYFLYSQLPFVCSKDTFCSENLPLSLQQIQKSSKYSIPKSFLIALAIVVFAVTEGKLFLGAHALACRPGGLSSIPAVGEKQKKCFFFLPLGLR